VALADGGLHRLGSTRRSLHEGSTKGPAAPPVPETITIASFNLQAFGPSKAGNPEAFAAIAEIVRRFDIVAVQEIRDSTGEAVVALRATVNSTGASYEFVIGPGEGRTTSKEQYAFFYNAATIAVLPAGYVFDEGGTDTFEREPYLCRFRVKNAAFDFALVDIHAKPDDAPAGISFLPTVIQNAVARTGEPDVICLGDFNADGL
jgi:deoxyribonuclease-1/deoxyribonuclease-1-like protein